MAAAASVFWACGEGNINGKNVNDEIVNASSEEDLKAFKEQAMKDCKDDINCYGKHQGYLDGTEVPTSSATPASSATNPVSSSSATKPNPVTSSSSSLSIVVRSSSSESDIVVSSSSEPTSSSAGTASGLGQCFPTVNGEKVESVQKNEAFKWQFKPANSMVFDTKGGTFTWVYGDGAEVGTDANGKYSASVKYAAANTYTATVTALLNGNSEDIPCTIKVTGIPITGCKCELDPTMATVDIADASKNTAKWIVSDCAPLNETFTYTWTGAEGVDNTATYSGFTAANQVHQPTVVVATAESDFSLECPAPKVTDGNNPETELDLAKGDAVDLAEGNIYTIKKCNEQIQNVVCDADKGGVELYVNGTLKWTSYDWQAGNVNYQTVGSICTAGTTLEVKNGSLSCKNSY